MKQKYIRFGDYNSFVFFPCIIDHDKIAIGFKNPISAGFCYIQDDKVSCFGESVMLELKSLPEDSSIATKQIFGDDYY
jgi:hypothetical protein